MYAVNVRAMEGFLTQVVEGGDFTDVAMRDDLRFTGPLASTTGAEEYRSICRGFAEVVRGISVRTMVGDDDVVQVVYDVDLRLESGPLRTSQTVEFINGAFAVVDVIFDAAAMAKDLRFTGPLQAYSDDERYRRDCTELADGVMIAADLVIDSTPLRTPRVDS